MVNPSQDILNCIRKTPGVSIQGIVDNTGWNSHLVEVSTKLLMTMRMIVKTGKTDDGYPVFSVI